MIKIFPFIVSIGIGYSQTINVSILKFKTKNVKNERSVKALYNEIEKVLRKLNYEIKPKKEVISIMSKEKTQLNNCDSNCFYNLGRMMNSDLLIIGDLSKTGKSYELILKIFNVHKKRFQKTVIVKSKKGSMKLITKLNKKLSTDMTDKIGLEINSNILDGNDERISKTETSTKVVKQSKNTNNSFLNIITDEQDNLKLDKKESQIFTEDKSLWLYNQTALEDSTGILSNEIPKESKINDEDLIGKGKSNFSKLRKHFGFAGQEDTQEPILSFNYDLPTHPIRYEIVDKYSKNIKHNENEPIYTLTDRITKNSNNEFEKVRAIYIWITKNISYDMESYLLNTITAEKVKPINVLKTKKTVCSGYANLFDVMAKHINVPTEVVSGFAKGYGYKPGDIMVNSNHAWNSIQLDGQQYLIDCTWGSGYISDDDKFVRSYREYYFLVDPNFLIWTHLPENPEFQMINKIISKDEFDILPHVSRSFFENRINFVGNHRVGYVVENELSLSYKIDDKIKLFCKLKDESEENTYEGVTYITKQDGNTNIKLRPPSSGNFFLQILSKTEDGANSYSGSIEYLITVPENYQSNSGFIKAWYDQIEKYNVSFPEIHSYRYYLSNTLTLDYICPVDVLLMATIKNSKNKEIENHTFIQKSNKGMQLMVNVPDEKEYSLNIYVKSINEEGNYSGLAEYKLLGDSNDKREVKSFPKQYGVFNENNGKLLSPLKGTLKAKQNYVFLLELDNAIEMSIIQSEEWTKFEKNNLNQFILNRVFEKKGKVQVGAKFSEGGSFPIILEYEVL